jgi:hypothetical protein
VYKSGVFLEPQNVHARHFGINDSGELKISVIWGVYSGMISMPSFMKIRLLFQVTMGKGRYRYDDISRSCIKIRQQCSSTFLINKGRYPSYGIFKCNSDGNRHTHKW